MGWREQLPRWHPMHRDPEPESEYSYCETNTAGPNSRWHIRKLTSRGRFLGGGADTRALCGREVTWDVNVEIDPLNLRSACPRCVQAYNNRG